MQSLIDDINSSSSVILKIIIIAIFFIENLVLIYDFLDDFIFPITKHIYNREYLSWKFTEKLVDEMVEKVRNSETKYGLIVGVGRSGGILGSLMSYRLNLKPIVVYDRNYEVDNNGLKTAKCMLNSIEMSSDVSHLKDKPVLLVTSNVKAGVTLNKYIQVLRNSGFTGIIDKCAFMVFEGSADRNIKYYITKYNDSIHARHFPWEKNSPDIYQD